MDDAKILRQANNIAAMPGNWHSTNAEYYATRFARALIAAHERIKELEAKNEPVEKKDG